MNNIVRLVNSERVQEQACDWVARLDAGSMSDADRDALTYWLNEDPCHGKTLVEMADFLDNMTILYRTIRTGAFGYFVGISSEYV